MAHELSPEMYRALKYAEKHGGKLERYPGGYWREPNWQPGAYVYGQEVSQSFGTSTVEGIVRRGRGQYTLWKDGKNGKFPVEMTVGGTTTPTPTG